MGKTRIALFASGAGSNALNIIDHFSASADIEVGFVLTNKSDALVIEVSKKKSVPVLIVDNYQVADGDFLIQICKDEKIDFIILAGYLRLIPSKLIEFFPERIINVHPALLPKFGGKGMHGENVHRAVLENKEKETGISIHYINERFDEGRMIAQFYCNVDSEETLTTLKRKIQILEHSYFPIVIEKTILNLSHV